MTIPLRPGLLVLHGNRLESLRDAVFDWLARNPLDPLEEEHFLVQSNGAAEWLKMSLARANGICAATRVELPGRFLWRAYRRVLGRQRVANQSALEREAMTWRLMRLLPGLVERDGFEAVGRFLADGDPNRRLQLARRLADLYDQYQVYRADWLAAWERKQAVAGTAADPRMPVPLEQRWQVTLWQAIVGELSRDEKQSTRPQVHRAFLDALASMEAPAQPLPRRVVLFGASHASMQVLEALAALAGQVQVIVAVPNPCRFHWADILDGREALHAARHRLPTPAAGDLSHVPFNAMHLYAPPLLAAWGRQGRDFMRLLDEFDDADLARSRFDVPRIDLFDDDAQDEDGRGTTMLARVQADIRDLVPPSEQPQRVLAPDDRSIVFHVAHGPQREVEILHDALLSLLAERGARRLEPREVVVMVPDIEVFAPAIRAVFGQYRRPDARFIPFEIADLKSRGSNPLVVALEWLLRIPEKRVRAQEVRDLLDVPAVAARFGVDDDVLPGLFAWLEGAGVRWGLHAGHRADLGLGAAGEQNSWLFGLRRMLLGYATGATPETAARADGEPFADVEPYDEIGGLDAAAVGALAALFERLDAWWTIARIDATPTEWAARGRALLGATTSPVDEREKLTVAALQAALAAWLEACDGAGFGERVPLSVMREAWLDGLDGLDGSRRFLAGGVTFCTLLPLRSVPFEVVCLLGMNDGDFPRRVPRNDFDLMGLPGRQRPGDRSRRDDDRYLMLEALLSARRQLYVGWTGRSARDNSEQPPSVLVAQLQDVLRAKWKDAGGVDAVTARTTIHPLQPFSRRYFEGGVLTTWAREWRAAHGGGDDEPAAAVPAFVDPGEALRIASLVRFLKNPVRAFFRARLDVVVEEGPEAIDDDEAFEVGGLDAYRLLEALLRDPEAMVRDGIDATLMRRLARLEGGGDLPMFELGRRAADALRTTAEPMLQRWAACRRDYPDASPARPLRIALPEGAVDDWLDELRTDGQRCVRVSMTPSRLCAPTGQGALRIAKLADTWVRMLAAGACGHAIDAILIGADAMLAIRAMAPDEATRMLAVLLRTWRDGMATPLPFAIRTALAAVVGPKPQAVYDGRSATANQPAVHAERDEFCLGRVFPDFEALASDRTDGGFDAHVERLFVPLVEWVRDAITVTEVFAMPSQDDAEAEA